MNGIDVNVSTEEVSPPHHEPFNKWQRDLLYSKFVCSGEEAFQTYPGAIILTRV